MFCNRLVVTLFSLALLFSLNSSADEPVGTLSIEMLRLRPTLLSDESVGASFSLSDSAFGLSWRKNKKLSAYVEVSSELSRNLPVYYSAAQVDRIGFSMAYAEYLGVYGRIRFGLIPLNFGYDGVLASHENIYNNALPYSERIIGLTDQGISFYTENNGYYTELVVHNGEIDTASDGRIWTSGNWGFTNGRHFRTQLSLQTGYVKSSVASSTNSLAGVLPNQTALWRNGIFFLNWYPRNWNIVAQIGGGEVKQDSQEGRYNNSMIEVTRSISKNFTAGFRYDQLDPDRKTDGDILTDLSLALTFKSADSTSQVIVLATKSIEESGEIPDDQLRLVWLLTPYAR
ncbi:MAG: hypothetical protein KDD38_03810 [Bdellovibrionales bacterium]|nr:hypothetical protein [Bdellovibrionales bacterium]